MKAPRLSSEAKTAIFIVGVLFLGILSSFVEEPESNKRNETDLEKRRRQEVFYRTFPVIQHLWSTSLGASSQFTITDIWSYQAAVGNTVGTGLLWSDYHSWNDRTSGLVGQMSYRFFHSKGKIEADSFWIEVFMPEKRVLEILNDPYDYSYESKPMFQKQRESAAKAWQNSRPIATLGEDAQRKLRQLSKGRSDTFTLAGMEWTLTLDKKQNLRIMIRGSLTLGMFPSASLRGFERNSKFRRYEVNNVWKVLRERAFVGEVYVSALLPDMYANNDYPTARLVAILPNGNAYIIGMLGQSSSPKHELHFRIGNEQTRNGDGATEDFRDEFRAYLQRIHWGDGISPEPMEIDTDGQYYVQVEDMKNLAESGTYPTFQSQR